MTQTRHPDSLGVQRHVDVGLRLAPERHHLADASKALGALLDAEPGVPVRLAGLGIEGGRMHLTVAVTLGTLEDVKAATPAARAAVRLLHRIVESLAAYEPCLVELPDPASPEAALAAQTPWRTATVRSGRGEGLLALIG